MLEHFLKHLWTSRLSMTFYLLTHSSLNLHLSVQIDQQIISSISYTLLDYLVIKFSSKQLSVVENLKQQQKKNIYKVRIFLHLIYICINMHIYRKKSFFFCEYFSKNRTERYKLAWFQFDGLYLIVQYVRIGWKRGKVCRNFKIEKLKKRFIEWNSWNNWVSLALHIHCSSYPKKNLKEYRYFSHSFLSFIQRHKRKELRLQKVLRS